MQTQFNAAKRIIIKIGSTLIVDQTTGAIRTEWLGNFIEDIDRLISKGKEVVIVSSGSIALGTKYIEKATPPLKLEEKQAAAACGQMELIHEYKQRFANKGIRIAQILLSIEDSEDRRRFLNARNTIDTILENDMLPIINENDTVATGEIKFGDNDRLAARVAQMVGADMLVLLSDIDGIYTANPQVDASARHIEKVEFITPEIEAMAGGSESDIGSGGMITKVQAAKIATASGCHMIIAKGDKAQPITAIEKGEKASWFVAKANPLSARKEWIAAIIHPQGEIEIDEGAKRALMNDNSLLPAGVTAVKGDFERGDLVLIKDQSGIVIARGLTAYNSADAGLIKGLKSQDIEALLGYSGRSELVHKSDLVLEVKIS